MPGAYWLCPDCGEPIVQDPELTEDEYDDAPCWQCESAEEGYTDDNYEPF